MAKWTDEQETENPLDRWLREDKESGRRLARHRQGLEVLASHGLKQTQEYRALQWAVSRLESEAK